MRAHFVHIVKLHIVLSVFFVISPLPSNLWIMVMVIDVMWGIYPGTVQVKLGNQEEHKEEQTRMCTMMIHKLNKTSM